MKGKLRRLAAVTAAALFLSGCRGTLPRGLDLANVEMVRVLGIDREGEELVLTASGGAKQGESPAPPLTVTARGESMTGACLALENGAVRTLSYAHITDVVFGEDGARAGVGEGIDYLTGEFDLRLSTRLFLLKGTTAREGIGQASSEQQDMSGHLQTQERDLDYTGPGFCVTALDAVLWRQDNGTFLLPVMEVKKEGEVVCTGLAWLEEDCLREMFSPEISRGMSILMGRSEMQSITVAGEGTPAAVLAEGFHCRVEPDWQAGVLRVTVEGEASVREPGDFDLSREESRRQLTRGAEGVLKDWVEQAMDAAAATGKDILHLGAGIAARAPERGAWLEENWARIYPTLGREVVCRVELRRGSEAGG